MKIWAKQRRNRFLLYMLLVLLLICSFVFCGCMDFSDEDTGDSGSGGGTGTDTWSGANEPEGTSGGLNYTYRSNDYKIAYRTNNEDDDFAYISELAETLVDSFVVTYGAGKGMPTKESVYYYDSIRYQPYEDTQNEGGEIITYIKADISKSWNWTIKYRNGVIVQGYANGGEKPAYESGADNYYNDDLKGEYLKHYTNIYQPCMEVVLYEMLLGETNLSQVITMDKTSNSQNYINNYPKIKYRNQLLSYEDDAAAGYKKLNLSIQLANLKAKYVERSTYYGFSLSDLEKIKNYILENVIGTVATNGQMTSNRCYRQYVDELLDGLIFDDPSCEYFILSKTTYKDGRLPLSSTNDTFKNIPKKEYQSLTLLPTESDGFKSYNLIFQAERDLNIKVYCRYYNGSTITTTTPQTVTVKAGAYDIETNDSGIMDFGPSSGAFNFTIFDNNSNVAAPTAKVNSKVNEVYKAVDSLNGFGAVSVLNEEKVNSSFVEVVFDVEKSLSDAIGTDYSFQVGIQMTIFQSDLS